MWEQRREEEHKGLLNSVGTYQEAHLLYSLCSHGKTPLFHLDAFEQCSCSASGSEVVQERAPPTYADVAVNNETPFTTSANNCGTFLYPVCALERNSLLIKHFIMSPSSFTSGPPAQLYNLAS